MMSLHDTITRILRSILSCYFTLLLTLLMSVSCAKEELDITPTTPQATGTFTDVRDGAVYHYVSYAGLDWMAENIRYQIADPVLCSVYQDADTFYDATNGNPSMRNLQKYGCLYSLEGARQAAPAGWRLPTDADWQRLEVASGMSEDEAKSLEWRGNIARRLMAFNGQTTPMNILMGGYYTNHTIMGTSGWRFKGSQAFFWTDTKDTDKNGDYYFYRKFFYNNDAIYRQSMEPAANKLSVRYVRDAQ